MDAQQYESYAFRTFNLRKPKRIKINHINYELDFIDRDSTQLNGNLGMCYYDQQKIFIASLLQADSIKDVLWHEVTHAILGESKFNNVLKEKLGEYYEVFVDSVADILLRFLEDNYIDPLYLIPEIKEQNTTQNIGG